MGRSSEVVGVFLVQNGRAGERLDGGREVSGGRIDWRQPEPLGPLGPSSPAPHPEPWPEEEVGSIYLPPFLPALISGPDLHDTNAFVSFLQMRSDSRVN